MTFTCVVNRRWSGVARVLGIAIALIATVGMSSGRAALESSPRITRLAVAVMPEYDQPRVLVSYYGELNADVSLPLAVSLRIPADAAVEGACSIKSATEEYVCGEYSTEPDGQYLSLTYEAVTPILYVEFYYGSTSGAGQRSLDFTLLPPYPVESLDLFVQEPRGATDFALSPAPAETLGDERFRHHSYNYQDLGADEPVSIQITYSRDTDEPSVAAPGTAASGRNSSSAGIPAGPFFLLGAAGAAVLGLALYAAIVRRVRVRRLSMVRADAADANGLTEEGVLYCPRCGGRIRPAAGFCSGCGQEVRPRVEEKR